MNTIGRMTLDLIPSKDNPRNSEGAFIGIEDGGILFAYSRFTGPNGGDDADCDIAAVTSYDNGESWSEPRVIVRASDFGVQNLMSVSALRMKNGDTGLFFLVKENAGPTEFALALSNDGGRGFYEAKRCSRNFIEGYYVVNNDRAERLSDGRIVLPAAFHRLTNDPDHHRIMRFDGSGTGFFFISDDDGRSFYQAKGRIVLDETAYSDTGIQEPGLIERTDGVLWVYARTDRGFQYESFSFDGLRSFTPVRQSRFTSPASPMKIKRNPATGILYSVWNPIPNYNGRPLSSAGWGRTPLAIAKSTDDGLSWSPLRLLEDDEERGYCYPAIYFTGDGCLLVAYCRGGAEDGMCLCRLGIKKIKLEEI
jgi:hypothetical protein